MNPPPRPAGPDLGPGRDGAGSAGRLGALEDADALVGLTRTRWWV
jgi:hypothetical protein